MSDDTRRDVRSARVRAVDPGTHLVIHPDARPGGRTPVWALVAGKEQYYLMPIDGSTLWANREDLVRALRNLGFTVDTLGFLTVR